MKRKLLILPVVLLLAAAGFVASRSVAERADARQPYETQPVRRGDLQVTVSTDGVVRAAQTAILPWHTSGTVAAVNVRAGEPVTKGTVLASLEQTSLPGALILAQAELVDAQRALEDLVTSQATQAAAQSRMEEAERLLENALNPGLAQANAGSALARAQKTFENARRNLEIAQSPASRQAIEAAHGVLLLWQNALERTRQELERVERRLKKDPGAYGPGESREQYEGLRDSLAHQLVRYQRRLEDASLRYELLLRPPDPGDVAVAEANLALAQAQLEQARREYDRIKDGVSPADLALLEAQLADARRAAERTKDGPDPETLAAAQARVDVAQAAVEARTLQAPFDGVITEVNILPGDVISPGSLAFRLDDLSSLRLDLQVSEMDINRLQPGQTVAVSLEGVPGVEYTGNVVTVPAVGEVVNDLVLFSVEVEIQKADSRVRPGMTASVEITTTDLPDTLLVPTRAMRFIDGQRVIYLLRDGKAVPVPVSLGLSSASETQVLEGDLQAGDLVILNP